MSKKTFRYRLYPTAAQRDVLDGQLRICGELYTAALQERRDAWRMARGSIRFAHPRVTSQHCTCGAHVPKTLSQWWHRVSSVGGRPLVIRSLLNASSGADCAFTAKCGRRTPCVL
jgi:hypothetical protein